MRKLAVSFLMEAVAAVRYVNSANFAGVSGERISEKNHC